MFASPSDQKSFVNMRRELRTGFTPAQFELDMLRIEQIQISASQARYTVKHNGAWLKAAVRYVEEMIERSLRSIRSTVAQG